jgi:hypothetical protein
MATEEIQEKQEIKESENETKLMASIEQIDSVAPHPNANRLVLVQILGYQMVVNPDSFGIPMDEYHKLKGIKGVMMYPDAVICKEWESDSLFAYLHDSHMGKRIKTVKIRDEYSQGLFLPLQLIEALLKNTRGLDLLDLGTDVTGDRRTESLWSKVQDLFASAGMTCYVTAAPKHARGAAAIVIGNPSAMYADQPGDPVTADKLFEGATTRAELIRLLRAAQAERDALVHETGRMQGEINGLVSRVQTLTEDGPSMETLSRRQLAEAGFADPSTEVLRARLMLNHAAEAHDLGLRLGILTREAIEALDNAVDHARDVFRIVTDTRLADELAAHKASEPD